LVWALSYEGQVHGLCEWGHMPQRQSTHNVCAVVSAVLCWHDGRGTMLASRAQHRHALQEKDPPDPGSTSTVPRTCRALERTDVLMSPPCARASRKTRDLSRLVISAGRARSSMPRCAAALAPQRAPRPRREDWTGARHVGRRLNPSLRSCVSLCVGCACDQVGVIADPFRESCAGVTLSS